MSNELGLFLEELRGKLSLREAAKKSGLSHTYIRDLELGINRKTKAPIRPSADTLKQLAEAYNYPISELLKKAGYLNEEHMHDEPYDPLAIIRKHLEDKGGAEQFGFFNIDEWKDLTPEKVEEILEDFEYMFQKAKKRNEEKK